MKHTALILLILLAKAGSLFSQSDFRKGYVITNANDTIWGLIEYRGNKSNARKCTFIAGPDNESSKTEYAADQIKAYRFTDGKFYVSKMVPAGEGGELLFLEYLINGKVDIFYYRDEFGEHYLLSQADDTLVPLTNDDKVVYENGVKYLQASNEYIGVLKYVFRESPAISNEAESASLNHKSLIRVTRDYHNAVCKDEVCIIYEKRIPRERLYIGPSAGLCMNWITRITNDFYPKDYYFTDSKWETTFSPAAGVFLRMTLPSLNERMSVQYDLSTTRIISRTTTEYINDATQLTNTNQISCTQYALCNALSLRYEVTAGRIRPVFMIGGFFNYAIKTNYQRDLTMKFPWGDPFISEEFTGNPFSSFIFGATVGTGCAFRVHDDQELYVDLKYGLGLGLFYNLCPSSLSLTVGVPFKI